MLKSVFENSSSPVVEAGRCDPPQARRNSLSDQPWTSVKPASDQPGVTTNQYQASVGPA